MIGLASSTEDSNLPEPLLDAAGKVHCYARKPRRNPMPACSGDDSGVRLTVGSDRQLMADLKAGPIQTPSGRSWFA
jgi:hypothetical protein